MKTKNIDLSMVHFGIADKDGEILINTDLLVKKGIYNDVVSFIIDGYEPDIQQDAIIYANKIENSTKSELIEIKELMNERSRLCILREDKKYIDLYDSLIRTVEERILTLPDVKEKHKQLSIPVELDTPEARELFDKTIQAGFMNTDYSFNGTRYQMAYFAEKASEHLKLKSKWKPFTQLWNYEYFAQSRRESKERFGYVDKQDEIDKIFR